MAFEKQSYSIHELKEHIKAYKESTSQYVKLTIYSKVVKGAISLISGLFIGFVGLIALLFVSVAVAIALSNVLDSPSAGFFIVGGFYILLIVLFFLFGKKMLQKTILLKTSRNFFKD
ncbi:hypothetical protein BH23BAC2_BH23BAC2_03310 [soil metagenome]